MSESDDRMDFWWDDESQMYVEGTRFGPMKRERQENLKMEYTCTVPKMMNDLGTRFRHIADFQEYLSEGLVAVTHSLGRYKNDSDLDRQKSLESALKLLNAYQNNLAEYDRQKFDFNQMLDECAPSKKVIDEIKSDRAAAAERAKAAKISEAQGNGQLLLGPSSLDEDTPLSS